MNESNDFNQDFSLSKEALERLKILLKEMKMKHITQRNED